MTPDPFLPDGNPPPPDGMKATYRVYIVDGDWRFNGKRIGTVLWCGRGWCFKASKIGAKAGRIKPTIEDAIRTKYQTGYRLEEVG